jgi:hypothetical protein
MFVRCGLFNLTQQPAVGRYWNKRRMKTEAALPENKAARQFKEGEL